MSKNTVSTIFGEYITAKRVTTVGATLSAAAIVGTAAYALRNKWGHVDEVVIPTAGPEDHAQKLSVFRNPNVPLDIRDLMPEIAAHVLGAKDDGGQVVKVGDLNARFADDATDRTNVADTLEYLREAGLIAQADGGYLPTDALVWGTTAVGREVIPELGFVVDATMALKAA